MADDRTIRAAAAAAKAAQETAPQRDAWRKVDALVKTLTQLMERDPEQEVEGIAVPVLAEVIELARSFVPDDPVVRVIQNIISPEFIIEADTSVRAADALLVATQLRTALNKFRPLPGV